MAVPSAPDLMLIPDFQLEDVEAWKHHLFATGVVRIRGVLDPTEVTDTKELFWDWLESLGGRAKRTAPATWTDNNFPGNLTYGFFSTYAGGQSAAAWAIRSSKRVHQAFQEIWGTASLISSMDTFIGWRPWWLLVDGKPIVRKPSTEGIHCDQNPHTKPGLACVQGMIPLLPVRRHIGGLCVVPASNSDAIQERLRTLFTNKRGDWLPLQQKYPEDDLNRRGQFIEADAGDLILWDSRCLHGAYIGPGLPPVDVEAVDNPQLARLAMTVCMVPHARATETVLEKRRTAVKHGLTLTHWPDSYEEHTFGDECATALFPKDEWEQRYSAPLLDDWQMQLVG